MGIHDRHYMRDDEPEPLFRRMRARPWSPTIALLAVLGAVFLCQWLLPLRSNIELENQFALSLDGIRHGRLWQLVTFQFLHGGFLHLLLNGFTLYSFGRFMEQELGHRRFLSLYFISGTAGGLLQVATTWLLRQPSDIPVVGASAGIAGLLGAFMLSHPNLPMIIIPIPFRIRAWTLLWIILPLSILGTVFPFGGIAHAAHLGGLLAGGAFIRKTWSGSRRDALPPFLQPIAEDTTYRRKESDTATFIASEVDPILDKISKQGIQSLTERERKILESARARMQKR